MYSCIAGNSAEVQDEPFLFLFDREWQGVLINISFTGMSFVNFTFGTSLRT